jgi:ubiquitin-protein ligase
MGLVKPVLIKRINNEISDLNDYLNLRIQQVPDNASFPIELKVGLYNTTARISEGATGNEHVFVLSISDNYPYERPRAKWLSPIFHPNIMMPGDGGFVCVKTLDNWSFGSTLLSFVKGVEQLLADPNPASPFGTESCILAAKWYQRNQPKFNASVSFGGEDA